MDLFAVPRMSAVDVVTAALAGIDLGEIVTALGLQDPTLLDNIFTADLAAFAGQSKNLAPRYHPEHASPRQHTSDPTDLASLQTDR